MAFVIAFDLANEWVERSLLRGALKHALEARARASV
jgi:hypothetical protein